MLTVLLALHMAGPKSQTPFAVANKGTGSTTQAPMRSTMQRFLMSRKLTVLIFSWHIQMLWITSTLHTTAVMMMAAITMHCGENKQFGIVKLF